MVPPCRSCKYQSESETHTAEAEAEAEAGAEQTKEIKSKKFKQRKKETLAVNNSFDDPAAAAAAAAMASACVNNNVGMSPPSFPSAPDFEFRLQDPVTMLPADQLFSDGKLVPLHLSSLNPSSHTPFISSPPIQPAKPALFSPKAPRCSTRWRDLLRLKKKHPTPHPDPPRNTSSKLFLPHRPPFLKDSDSESLSISSRLSLSSSSSGHDHDDLPRLSLDSDKPAPSPSPAPISLHRNPNAHPRIRLVKPRPGSFDNTNRVGRSPIRRPESGAVDGRGVSVDSPRMNSSGKIVFQSLERSSSSPSSCGGPRLKHRGMERSYSANVRVTPVLNVPVCSLRGSSKTASVFGLAQFFSSSPQKKEGSAAANGATARNRCNRN